jgi:hypothetical protein
MTTKDYVKFAEMFANNPDLSNVGYVKKVADILAEDNPRFKRNVFLKACGILSLTLAH